MSVPSFVLRLKCPTFSHGRKRARERPIIYLAHSERQTLAVPTHTRITCCRSRADSFHDVSNQFLPSTPLLSLLANSGEEQGQVHAVQEEEAQHQPEARPVPLPLACTHLLADGEPRYYCTHPLLLSVALTESAQRRLTSANICYSIYISFPRQTLGLYVV